eukprot:jgi/Ulvmu1/7276/UM035_0064.1
MAGNTDAADAPKPFNWQDIEDEDELSFGSEYESDGEVDADASSPQSREAGGTANDATTKPKIDKSEAGMDAANGEAADANVPEVKVEPKEADTMYSKDNVVEGRVQQDAKAVAAKLERKAPRTPVRWTAPPTKSGENEKTLVSIGGGVRGKTVPARGLSAVQTQMHKKAMNPTSGVQPRARGPWAPRAPFGAHETILSGMGGRGGVRDPLSVGRFMKRRPDMSHRHHGDGMSSALNQLKTQAPMPPSQASAAMNPAARPFKPRPPSQPPQHAQPASMMQPRPPPRPAQPPSQPPPQLPTQRPQPISSMPYAYPRHLHARPAAGAGWPVVAPASTWVRGQSDAVDNEAAQKPAKSSTWVNPNVAAATVPTPAAATTAAVAHVKSEDATAEALRQKDEEIAALRAKLERQVAPKRPHEEVKEEDKVVPKAAPRKILRAGDGTRAQQIALTADGRRGQEPRPRGDIFSRVQFSTRNREDVVHIKDEKPAPARSSRSPPPVYRDHRKDSSLDSARQGTRRGERSGHASRHDDRRQKSDLRRTENQQSEMSEEQKLRLQRFGGRNPA